MNLRTRLLAAASALTMFAGIALIGSTPAGAVTTFNVGNDGVTCNTVSATMKFASHLKNSGPTTGSNTISVALALAGCFDDDNSNVKMFKGASKVHIATNNGWNCASLLGMSNVSGSAQIVWTPATGQAFTPKTTVGTVQKSATNLTFTQLAGGYFSVPAAYAPWNAAYLLFSAGTAYGTAPLSASVDFTGGDGGANSWFIGITQQDVTNVLTQCGTTAGVATLNDPPGAYHIR